MEMTNKEKIEFIAEHYGYDAQSRQCIEEMAELTQSINKFWRNQLDCGKRRFHKEDIEVPSLTYENLIEEICDVQIMIWQMLTLLNVSDDYFKMSVVEKLDRQMKRIKEK